jgi:hypothetical protein
MHEALKLETLNKLPDSLKVPEQFSCDTKLKRVLRSSPSPLPAGPWKNSRTWTGSEYRFPTSNAFFYCQYIVSASAQVEFLL